MAHLSGPYGWAGDRRELLDIIVQGSINRGRHIDHPAGRHSTRTNQCPPSPSPISHQTTDKYLPQLTSPREWTACVRPARHAAQACPGLVDTSTSSLSRASRAIYRRRRPTGNLAAAVGKESERTSMEYWRVVGSWTTADLTMQSPVEWGEADLWTARCDTSLRLSDQSGVYLTCSVTCTTTYAFTYDSVLPSVLRPVGWATGKACGLFIFSYQEQE